MNGETIPVQIRIWFPDGGFYDLRGILDSFQQDNDLSTHSEGMHTFHEIIEKHWTLVGRARPWEFDKDGKPSIAPASAPRPILRLASVGPDRSPRARRRARAKARRRHAT